MHPDSSIFTAICASQARKCRKRSRPARGRRRAADLQRFAACRIRAGERQRLGDARNCRAGRGASGVRVWPIGAASIGSKGEALAEIAAMKDAGIVAVSDDGKPVATARLMRQVMDYCDSLDLPVIDHCEDPSLFAGGVMREGRQSVRLGLKGIPAQSESICVGRDVEVARLPARDCISRTCRRADRSNHVRKAKKRGLRVTCEVTPHHFTLTDEDVRYDSNYKMNPPLASREDRDRTDRRLSGRKHRCHRHRSCAASSCQQGRGVRPSAFWNYRI